jgi:tetratricopeptide (TPR) repeat protein
MAKRARPKAGRAERKTRRPDRPVLKQPRPSASSVVASPAKPPLSPAPDPEAITLFQHGVEALQRHAYQPATERFRAVLERFPSERALLDRARVYLEICRRELERRPPDPRTVEERLTAATAAVNNGDNAQAERLVRTVLAADARHDLALYLMAVIEARRGATEAALSYLSQAVAVSPEVRAQARHDADFESLRNSDAFHALVDPPTSPFNLRRQRRR